MKRKIFAPLLCLCLCASVWAQTPQLQADAERGDAEAQYKLCKEYDDKSFEDKNENKSRAITWCRKAAEQGYSEAQFLLGWILGAGWYVGDKKIGQDEKQAAAWYLKAAKQGNKKAQYNLSVFLAEGRGVAKNCKEATMWRKKSGEAGRPVCL